MSTLARYQFTAVDTHGEILPSASIEVRLESDNSLPLLYSDRAGAIGIGNPFTADAITAFAAFHVIGGAYKITVTKDTFTKVFRYVGIGTASEYDRFQFQQQEIDVRDYGAVSGEPNSRTSFQAAMTAGVGGQRVIIPVGNWTIGSDLTYSTTYPTWIAQPGFVMSVASLNHITAPYPGTLSGFGVQSFELARSKTNTQECYKFIGFQIPANTGTIGHEREALTTLIRTSDDELATGSSVYKAAVGLSARGYIASGNANGRAFGANLYGLIETGGEGVAVGCEVDVYHNGHENATPFAGDIKAGLIVANQGPVPCTMGIQISGNPFWYGFLIVRASIKNNVDARAFLLQDVFSIDRDGYITVGKQVHDRNVAGVEFDPTGPMYQSGASTVNFIQTVIGTPGTGVICQNIAQQKNSAGTLKTFSNQAVVSSVVTAGAETGTYTIDALFGGATVNIFTCNGSRIGPGTDNAVTCGHPSFRYSTVYAGTGTINTSDVTLKDSVSNIEDKVLNAWGRARARSYQWKDALEAKGKNARVHFGWIAQNIVKEFEAEGLDPWRYAPLCKDEIVINVKVKKNEKRQKTEMKEVSRDEFKIIDGHMTITKITEIKKMPVTQDHLLFDENGNPVNEKVRMRDENQNAIFIERQRVYTEQVFENIEIEVYEEQHTGEYRMGLRYSQCLVLETAWLRREVEKLTALLKDKLQ